MKKNDQFTRIIFRRLWIPAIISAFGWSLSDIADAVVVGQKLGTVGLAAISLILPVYMINCFFVHGLGIGGSVLYAKLLGRGKSREACYSFNRVLQITLLLSLLIVLAGNIFMTPLLALLGTVPEDGELFIKTRDYLRVLVSSTPLFYLSNLLNYYLRNDDNEKIAGIGSVISNGTDIGLNFLFVMGLGWGTMGAALATTVGQIVAIVCYLPGVFGRTHILQIKKIRPSFKEVLPIFRDGLNESVMYLYKLVFILICNNILIRMGNAESVAVFDLLQNASYLIVYLYEGTNRATMPLVSTYFGEHREKESKAAFRLSLFWGYLVGGLMTAWIFISPGSVCMLFGIRNAAVLGMGETALRIYCLGMVFAGFSLLLIGYYQSVGKEKYSFLIVTMRDGVIAVLSVMAFSLNDAAHFWWAFPVNEMLSLFLSLLLIRISQRKRKEERFDSSRIWTGLISEGKEDLSRITGEVENFCEKWNALPKQSYFVCMTVEEISLAIIKNGYPNGGECLIDLVLVAEGNGDFTLHIRDNAVCFNPFDLKTDKLSSKENVDPDAMGMMVIREKSREFFYRQYGGFNSLVVKI